jgi:hypothetical protein
MGGRSKFCRAAAVAVAPTFCVFVTLLCVACGGAPGGSATPAGTTGNTLPTAITFAANSVVYGVATGQSENYDVNEMSSAGANVQTVAANIPGTILLFALDPATSGQYVIAADPTGTGSYGIYLSVNLTLTDAQTIVGPNYAYVTSLAVTENGASVVFSATDGTGISNLFVVPIGGGVATKLGLSDGSAVSPLDSDTIAYVAPIGGSGNDQLFTRSLSAGSAGSSTQLTSDVSNHALPAFSPDGTKLAFWELNVGTNTLVVDTLATSTMLNMPNPAGIQPQGEAFSADGTSIVIAGEVGTQGNILTQPTDGSASPTAILSSASLLGNYGIYWTDANGRAVGGIQGMSASSRLRKRRVVS